MLIVPPVPPDQGSLGLRLDTLTRLRWLAIAGQTVAVLVVALGLGFPVPLLGSGLTIVAAAAFNVGLNGLLAPNHRFDAHTSALILACDVLQLSVLLYFTGGVQNPFAMLFLAPVLISAAALPPRHTLALGALAVALASVLMLSHRPLPWTPGEAFVLPRLYAVGIWVSILVSLAFIGVYAWRVAAEARQMAQALSLTELALVRAQHLTALDGVAAAAAHKLGTPLATIAVVVKEMHRQLEPDDPLKEDVTLLMQESARCREILSRIASIGQDEGGPLGERSIEELLDEIVAPHRQFDIEIAVDLRGTGPQPRTARNPGLFYGIGNLIENAMDFARRRVTVTAEWTDATVSLTVADDGPGFTPEVLQRFGDPFLTTRSERLQTPAAKRGRGGGMGLGLFITKTLLERSGATLACRNAAEGGARVTMHWSRSAFSQPLPRVLG